MGQSQKFFKEALHIDEILLEANACGLRREVDEHAKKVLKENPTMNSVEAYQLAYQEWVK